MVFNNKVLMITGGTGSFGNAVLDKFINTDVSEIRVFSRDESKQEEQRHRINNSKVSYYIGDIRDPEAVGSAIRGVDFIFHAAALKQVPSCEFYPMEAIKTNVIGANNIISASINNNVNHLILLSTDKAVYPINAMGLSKSMMEKVMVARSRETNPSNTKISATRYGNVMASRGSVIPHWINQIKNDQALMVTNPDMTRFLMSLEESIDLVLHSYNKANTGEIYIQKAPAASMRNLSIAIKELFNFKKEDKIIGTRHGEKLFETLVSSEEKHLCKETNTHFIVRSDQRDLNYKKYISEGETSISDYTDYTSHNTKQLNVNEIKEILKNLPFVSRQLKNILI